MGKGYEKLSHLLDECYCLADGFWYSARKDGAIIYSKEEINKGHSGEVAFLSTPELISKEHKFIKWLVDNDKIDRKKLEIRPFSDELVYSDSDCTVYRSDTTYEMLLMLLAIQDEPIEFLTEILKTEKQYTEEEQELLDLDYGTGYTKKFVK